MKKTDEAATFVVIGINKRGVITVPKEYRELHPNWDKDAIFEVTMTRVELGQ